MPASSSLRQRLLTAAVLIPLTAWGILALPSAYVALLFGSITLLAAWEWAGLIRWTSPLRRLTYTLGVGSLLYLVWLASGSPRVVHAVLLVGAGWWIVALSWVLCIERGARVHLMGSPAVGVIAGWMLLIPAWLSLVLMHARYQGGPTLVMFLLMLVWVADTGAYFVGRRWGATPMAPRVSPGKTWEGAAAGTAAAGLFAAGTGAFIDTGIRHLGVFVLLCLAVALVSIVGDLAESLFKRRAGVKDSGELLPGHGGILDRIDSITAAAPFFALGLYWLGRMT